MDADTALARVSAAVVAAFPDRANAFLDAIERAFRMSRPMSPPGAPCVFCGRGQHLRYPFYLPAAAMERPFTLRPAVADERIAWSRLGATPDRESEPLACLDCALLVRDEFTANPPSAIADRLLQDALRAVRQAGGEEAAHAANALEDAFSLMDAPRRVSGEKHECALCSRMRECAGGPAGDAICAECAGDYARAIEIDPLTGAENRARFGVRLHLAIERAHRLSRPLALLFTDVDHMKSFNDIHGFMVGDALLTRVPSVVQSAGGDAVCRYGGEEFAVLLVDRTLPEAVRIGEAIRMRALATLRPPDLEVTPYELERLDASSGRRHFPEGRVSVSIGIAALGPEEVATDLIRAADDRVQEAKNSGRNCVCA